MQIPKNMVQVTDESFDEVVSKSDLPVLFVMGATWCPDCMRLAPFVGQLAQTYEGKVLFVRADFDTATGLKERFAVKHIPTLALIVEGKVKGTLVEPKSIAEVKKMIEEGIK